MLSPAPYSLPGRNRFQSPRARASALRSSITGGWKCESPEAATCSRVDRLGRIDALGDEVCESISEFLGASGEGEVHDRDPTPVAPNRRVVLVNRRPGARYVGLASKISNGGGSPSGGCRGGEQSLGLVDVGLGERRVVQQNSTSVPLGSLA